MDTSITGDPLRGDEPSGGHNLAPLICLYRSSGSQMCKRVLIRRWDPGTITRIHKSLYLPTFTSDIKRFTSSDLFCPPTLL